MEKADYVAKYGDVSSNGRGDKEVKGPGGQELVLVSSERVWTKKVQIIKAATRTSLRRRKSRQTALSESRVNICICLRLRKSDVSNRETTYLSKTQSNN